MSDSDSGPYLGNFLTTYTRSKDSYNTFKGSPKKHEKSKTTWGLLTKILEILKVHSIMKISLMLLKFY